MNRFENKVAIVTGSGGGIGQAYVEALAREGAAVVVADINVEGATVTDTACDAAPRLPLSSTARAFSDVAPIAFGVKT